MALIRANPPTLVRFAGWQADTVSLGRAGWQISIINEPSRMTDPMADYTTIIVHHERLGLTGYGHCVSPRSAWMTERYQFSERPYKQRLIDGPVLTFDIDRLAPRVIVARHVDPQTWRPVWNGTDPSLIEVSEIDLHTLPLFQEKARPAAEEIIVEPATVQSLLEQIRQIQEPEQAAIRARARQRERDAIPQLHATILTFPLAA